MNGGRPAGLGRLSVHGVLAVGPDGAVGGGLLGPTDEPTDRAPVVLAVAESDGDGDTVYVGVLGTDRDVDGDGCGDGVARLELVMWVTGREALPELLAGPPAGFGRTHR